MKKISIILTGLCLFIGAILAYDIVSDIKPADRAWIYGSLIACVLVSIIMSSFVVAFFVVRGVFFSAIDAANQSQMAGQSQVNSLGKIVSGVAKMRQYDVPQRPVFQPDTGNYPQLPGQQQGNNNLMPLPFSSMGSQNLIIDGLPTDDEEGDEDSYVQ